VRPALTSAKRSPCPTLARTPRGVCLALQDHVPRRSRARAPGGALDPEGTWHGTDARASPAHAVGGREERATREGQTGRSAGKRPPPRRGRRVALFPSRREDRAGELPTSPVKNLRTTVSTNTRAHEHPTNVRKHAPPSGSLKVRA